MPSPSINCFPSLMWKTWVLTSTSSNSGGMNWTTDGEPGLITSSITLKLWRLNVVFICILYHHVYLWTSAEWIITWSTSIFHLINILTRKCTVCLHVALISKCSLPLTCNHTHTHTLIYLCEADTEACDETESIIQNRIFPLDEHHPVLLWFTNSVGRKFKYTLLLNVPITCEVYSFFML